MEIYLTSSPFAGHEDPADSHTACDGRVISEKNGFAGRLKKSLEGCSSGLFIASDPDAAAFMDQFSEDVRTALMRSGIRFESWQILDQRTWKKAASMVTGSDFVVLAGGHTPTENRFFREIGLQQMLKDRCLLPGPFVVMGISAGSMNAAETVYAMPEEEGESLDPKYERFLPGLGLTTAMIVPHYQRIKDNILDGKRLFADIGAPDSMGRSIWLLSDGSYLYIKGDQVRFYGELHLMKDGTIRKIASDGGVTALISS